MDSTPVEDSTDSDSHCERALCLSSQEGHDGHSTFHELWLLTKWTRLLWRTARTLTLIARGHCACHPRKAMMVIPHAMNLWIKPTNPHATAAMVDLWSKTTWTQLLWRTARTLTLIARGHCACHPRKAMVASPQTMIAWIKPTKSTRYSSCGGFTATDHGLMGSHRSTGYSSPGVRRQITHKSTRYSSRGGFTATDHGPTGYSSPGGSTGSRSGIMTTNEVELAPVEDSI